MMTYPDIYDSRSKGAPMEQCNNANTIAHVCHCTKDMTEDQNPKLIGLAAHERRNFSTKRELKIFIAMRSSGAIAA